MSHSGSWFGVYSLARGERLNEAGTVIMSDAFLMRWKLDRPFLEANVPGEVYTLLTIEPNPVISRDTPQRKRKRVLWSFRPKPGERRSVQPEGIFQAATGAR